ncbi:mannose-6-phosphate isomerase, class I [Micromonospora sp. NBC_01813]|uniref:mannose-6-phosphate isomerase, class I n=1 Tax=Micromonospora sp. NBC_01813 TaxID=2975988 RepID=UPI002DD957E8|nr:mannose-6-phosphate isomerase, class I [Micromonospora sp. NBC_01813]WSA08443.1 mannose-6-phosphate isomerase, class I [Micromonospora sp. NBC_01813]
MELLTGQIRDYAWGSRTVIAQLQGRPAPAPGPEAELWLGAHPGAPSTVHRDGMPVSVAELIGQDPAGWLGEPTAERFGGRLPYLMKILAAETPLSLQAHPDAALARERYAAERAGSVADGGFNYADPYHKPELLVALTSFDALCGFRDPQRSAEVLAALRIDGLEPVVKALRTGPGGLCEAMQRLLTWPADRRADLVGAAVAAVADLAPGFAADGDLLRGLARHYPADPGVLVALLLNKVTLAPGEAVWMPAGNLHAYLHGAGVEIMAASDNVLRGGLTPKHVDVAELLRVLRFEVLTDPVVRPQSVTDGVITWPAPVAEFALHRVVLDDEVPQVTVAVSGPRVVLCLAGGVAVDDGLAAVAVPPGRAAFGPALPAPLTISGAGEVFVASVNVDFA